VLMNFRGLWIIALIGPLLIGCKKQNAVAPPTTVAPPHSYPTAAQLKLPTIKLWIGAEEMVTEMALTDIQMETGMMFRTNLAENEGMIFVYGSPRRVGFWMLNCPLPLSAAYIDPEGVILEIRDLEPHNTNSVVSVSEDVQYVLETSRDWFKRKKIGPGTLVRTEKGSLRKTFFRQ
jgi:uncharacterized protein